MNKKAAERIMRAAVAVLVGASVFWWAPVMPASRVQASSCAHENCEWVTMVKPTCSKPGKEVMICQDCEEILETEEIEKTEHKGKWEKTLDPTCAHEGVRSYVCKNCKFVIKTEAISPTGKHKNGDWTIESIEIKGRAIKVMQRRVCRTCRGNEQLVTGTTSAFPCKHGNKRFYYKYFSKTGRVVILCSECHQSSTGKISGGNLKFTKPKKDNSKPKSKGWKLIRR